MPRFSRRKFLLSATGLATTGLTAFAWSPQSFAELTDGKIRRGGSLTASIGFPEPELIFQPAGGGGSPTFTGTKIVEKLLRLDANQNFIPALAESWEASPDFKTFVIRIQRNVAWHDGKDFTADDVAFSIGQYWKPFASGGILKVLDSVTATDRYTVLVRFEKPVPEFSFATALETGYIIPKHIYETGNIILNPANAAPIGTGPWKFKKWVRGSHVEYAPNENYRIQGQPYLDQLIIRWWRDPAARAAALETGELDVGVSNPVPLADVDRLRHNPNLVVSVEDGISSGIGLHFNVRRPITSKREVRQALLHAIDQKFICETIYYGFAKPGISPLVSTNSRFFTSDVPRYDFDPAKAARLLNAAGYPVGADGKRFEINLMASGWSEENGKTGTYLKQVFEDLKIRVKLKILDRPNSLKTLYTDYDFDIAYSQGGGTTGEPVPSLTQLFSSEGIAKGVPFRNASGYSDSKMDALIEQITYETNPDKRRSLIQDFARLAVVEAPVFPLVEWIPHRIHRKGVQLPNRVANFGADPWGDAWLNS